MGSQLSYGCFIFSFFLAIFLVGCGGGGGGKSKSSPAFTSTSSFSSTGSTSSNTAPTLTGSFNLNAKAQGTGILTVHAADAENDQLQVSILNKPEWLSTELNNNQVTITAKPDFFDIKDHSLTLSISDGKLSSEYTLSISVVDDASKWVQEAIVVKDLVGSWEIDDGSRLYIYPNGTGIYITRDNKINLLKWSEYQSGDIEITIRDSSCPKCMANFPLSTVAKKEGYLRLLINDNPLALNAKKLEFTPPANGIYLNLLSLPNGDAYSEISESGKKLSLRARVEANFILGSFSNPLIYSLNFSALNDSSNTSSAVFTVTEPSTSTIPISFVNINTGLREMLTLKAQPTSIELMPSSGKDLVVHVQSKLVLAGDSEDKDINDYEPKLEVYLTQVQETYYEALLSTSTAAPVITAGDKYYLPNVPARWEGIKYAASETGSAATTVIFETSSEGYVSLESPFFDEPKKHSFKWAVADQSLTLTFDNNLNAISYSFSLVNGVLYALNNQVKSYAPLIKETNSVAIQVPAGFYFGKLSFKSDLYLYQYMYLAASPLKGFQLLTSTSKSGIATSHYRVENNVSITFLIASNCSLTTFFECEELFKEKIANNETGASLMYVNFKPIAKVNDLYTFIQTRYSLTSSTSTVFQSMVNLTYDEFGYNH